MAASNSTKVEEEGKYDWNEVIEPHVKIAVVGEKGCGKSSLILAACNGIFPHPEDKFLSKQYPLDIQVDGGQTEACMVAEMDSGDDQIGRRKNMYKETDAILLCFDDATKLAEVEQKWIAEIKEHVPNVPVILVLVRKKIDHKVLSSEHTELEGLSGLQECCPYEKKGVKEVFQEAVKKAKEHVICEKR